MRHAHTCHNGQVRKFFAIYNTTLEVEAEHAPNVTRDVEEAVALREVRTSPSFRWLRRRRFCFWLWCFGAGARNATTVCGLLTTALVLAVGALRAFSLAASSRR